MTSSTDDFWEPDPTVAPAFMKAGATAVLELNLKPTGSGTVVSGTLYVETYSPSIAEKTRFRPDRYPVHVHRCLTTWLSARPFPRSGSADDVLGEGCVRRTQN